jgi:LCP family protein required for cell wall assembly
MRFLPRTRGGVLWRALLAGVVVIGFVAATTAVAGLLQVKQVVDDLNLTKALKNVSVQLPASGQPQTLLLIGADARYGQKGQVGNTDTMLLMRIDDTSSTINMLSIPRDLEVQLPIGAGGVMEDTKLNEAYAVGGPQLLLNTLKTQVFPGLHVNHIVVFSFAGFAKMVNAIGCVYADVDHRYYNNTAQTDYSSIDIQPGYQQLCGGTGANLGGPDTALAFVRFRHTDSDEIRNARQQDFIRWAKDEYGTSYLLDHESTLLTIFGKNSQTDGSLHTTAGLLNLFDLAINADGQELKTIQFPEAFGPCGGTAQTPCYVFATSAQAEANAYTEFMTPTTSVPSIGSVSAKSKHGKHAKSRSAVSAGLTADPGDGKSQSGLVGGVGMPVYYPTKIPSNYAYCFSMSGNCVEYPNPPSEYDNSYPRKYKINGPDNKPYAAYVFTLVPVSGGETDMATGEYFTVQGTTWQDPPLLAHPSAVEKVGGKTLDVYSQGGLISTVAWHTAHGVYWIENTLQNTIPNTQMVAMAASFTRDV